MRNSVRPIVFLFTFAAASAVFAQSASERVTKLEAETLVLKARERQLDVQASIITKQNEILLKQAAAERMTQTTVAENPVIRSIESIGSAAYATLQLANGHLVDVQGGDILPNGMKVVAIKPNEVIVEKNKRRTRLSAASETPAQFNPNYPAVGLGLRPPLPAASRQETAR